MVFFKVIIATVLASLAACEPPVSGSGYNYNAPQNSYNSASNSYLPPASGFNPQGSYPTASGSGSSGHGHGHGHDNEVPKSYEFGYSVKDAQSVYSGSDGNVVRGEYRVALPDGRTQIVTYHADWKTGFHADVKYEGEARYPEPTKNNHQQGGYNYKSPDFSGSLSGFGQAPVAVYGPPGYQR